MKHFNVLTNLLAAGPKLRLLARLARLESRSPVTSLLSVVGVVEDRGDTIAATPATGGVIGGHRETW